MQEPGAGQGGCPLVPALPWCQVQLLGEQLLGLRSKDKTSRCRKTGCLLRAALFAHTKVAVLNWECRGAGTERHHPQTLPGLC